jgi:hypothetical protein
MAYGKIKADSLVHDNGGSDVEVTISSLAAKAGLASPTFTGTPAAPTAAQGTNTTQIATTAFVNAEITADTANLAPLASPNFTGIPVARGDGSSTDGQIQLNCSQNSHGVKIKSPPHSANASYTLTLPNDTGTSGYALTTNGSGVTSWSQLPTVDPNTAVTDAAQTFTPAQTFTAASVHNGGLTVDGPYKQAAEAVSALDIDLSTGNYFTKTINGNSTFTFSNPPASGTVGSFTLELTHTSGTVAWPSSVKFNADTAPTLTAGKTHLFFFVTDDGGTRYRGAALVDYVN